MDATPERKREDVWNLIASTLETLGVPADRITPGASLADDLGLESVAFVELQVTLEDELGIEIDPIQVVELNELSAIVDYLCGLPRVIP
ncbi:acyl carrier protein [bacterium]|nr:acyl carrier protein [bacterium]